MAIDESMSGHCERIEVRCCAELAAVPTTRICIHVVGCDKQQIESTRRISYSRITQGQQKQYERDRLNELGHRFHSQSLERNLCEPTQDMSGYGSNAKRLFYRRNWLEVL